MKVRRFTWCCIHDIYVEKNVSYVEENGVFLREKKWMKVVTMLMSFFRNKGKLCKLKWDG